MRSSKSVYGSNRALACSPSQCGMSYQSKTTGLVQSSQTYYDCNKKAIDSHQPNMTCILDSCSNDRGDADHASLLYISGTAVTMGAGGNLTRVNVNLTTGAVLMKA